MASEINLYILSELHPTNTHVGWMVSYGLEKVLLEACSAKPIYPVQTVQDNIIQRYRNRLFQSWFTIKEPPVLGQGVNILLAVGLKSHFMLSMFALGPLLKRFDMKVGYLLDGFDPAQVVP